MSMNTPIFLLRVAKALVEEVAEKLKAMRETIFSTPEERLDRSKINALAAELERDLEIALSLCDRVAKADPDVILEDGATPSGVIASALFRRGLIKSTIGKHREAVQYYEQSLKYSPDQATYYNIGLNFLSMKGIFTDRTQDAVAAFEKCIELDPESEMAIKAGKELARLRRL